MGKPMGFPTKNLCRPDQTPEASQGKPDGGPGRPGHSRLKIEKDGRLSRLFCMPGFSRTLSEASGGLWNSLGKPGISPETKEKPEKTSENLGIRPGNLGFDFCCCLPFYCPFPDPETVP